MIFFVFCFFVGRWALNRPRYSFSNLFLVREREREREACTEVTTVYSSAHTINLWAHLCVPQRHTALQVLLPSLKASTEADGDYCVTGEVENKEMERWSSKLCWWTFPVPLPSIEQSRLLYRCIVERVFEWNSVDDIWSADHKDMRLYIAVTFRLHLLCKIQNTIQVDLIVLILMYGYLYD